MPSLGTSSLAPPPHPAPTLSPLAPNLLLPQVPVAATSSCRPQSPLQRRVHTSNRQLAAADVMYPMSGAQVKMEPPTPLSNATCPKEFGANSLYYSAQSDWLQMVCTPSHMALWQSTFYKSMVHIACLIHQHTTQGISIHVKSLHFPEKGEMVHAQDHF